MGQEPVPTAPEGTGPEGSPPRNPLRANIPGCLLLVEDDRALGLGMRDILIRAGHEVHLVQDGAAALEAVRSRGFDMILLDLNLPCVDGLEVLRILREEGFWMRVLVLTARDREPAVSKSFDLGADDFLQKPAESRELIARIDAQLRRARTDQEPEERIYEIAPAVKLNLARNEVLREGEKVGLTQREGRVLSYLIHNSDRVVTRENLLTDVWGYKNPWVQSRTVDILISSLRRKVEPNPNRPTVIQTVRGRGYRWGG